jgi:nucleoid DNA-binding protein
LPTTLNKPALKFLTTTYHTVMELEGQKKCLTIADIDEKLYTALEGAATRKDLKKITTAIYQIIEDAIVEGYEIKVAKLFTVSQVVSKERVGRNPSTGEAITIAPRRYARFATSPNLQKRVGGLKD